ncbi:MAG: DUF512 domain-containing protein [Oscillospiraceae bacterium]|nr:DUF512 domain-containing protein [Oscillospiraceae bacterium]
MSAEITGVTANSPAARHGIKKGDILVSINGHRITDVLDYMYYSSENTVTLLLERDNKHLMLKIRKSEYDDLGLEFNTFLMDKKQSCCNKCVFCFIDQMPKGMRKTLYFKDDDARLSFLQGNYVTLTNLKQEDIDRIIEMKLNINISVHTTNPELRCRMMNNRFAGEKIDYLRQLADAGISMNCQIVLCPGLNDGDELRRTLTDLGNLMPNISSVAIVPVGLTKFREGLYPLTMFDKEGAGRTIDIIEGFQKEFLGKYGTRLVFPSDEFYLKAERPLPEADFYEEYPQYENGVGMMRSLYDEFFEALETAECEDINRDISIATGAAAFDMISELAHAAEEKFGIRCRVYKIINHFFGETITVAGLLTAQDIISQLKDKELGTELLLSRSMIIHDGDLFLDDYTISDTEKMLGVKLRFAENDGGSLLDAILGR